MFEEEVMVTASVMYRISTKISWSVRSISNHIWFQILALSYFVILVCKSENHRCSHMPPKPDVVTHVWLDEQNINLNSSYKLDQFINTNIRDDHNLTKRHIKGQIDLTNLETSVHRSMWNALERLETTKDDIVPMKIQVSYDKSVHLLSPEKFELIVETVIPTVIKFFENVLSMRREYTIDKFRISRRCPNNTIYYAKDLQGYSRPYCMDRCEDYAICGEMVVPQNHLSACSYCNSTSKRCVTDYANEGKGVAEAQLVLYVSAKQTTRCKKDQTIAYAAHCAQDAKTDRPVAGHANLCPSSISTDPKDLKALIATVKHELTHVLGFSVSLFAYYRDKHGQPLTKRDPTPGPIQVDPKTGYAKWSEKVIKRIVRKGWKTGGGEMNKDVHLIVTPSVVKEVRVHFNCSTLEGAELEDQGSDGTSMTHWEKRLFENEAMTGTHTQNSVYSHLTLAVLQDTGWYIANFTRAERLDWGKDLGCDFAKKSCKSWIDERKSKNLSIRPFCDRVKGDLLQISCTEDRSSKAVCNMKQYSEPLPLIYQNFDNLKDVHEENLAYYGGSVDLADYCPFIQEFTWQSQNVTVRGSRCDLGTNNMEHERNAALEFYGPQTRCFEHGRRWEQRSCIYKRHWHHHGAGCYRYRCSNGHFTILVSNTTYPCYYSGQAIHIEQLVDQWLYNGTLICPPCSKICPNMKCHSFDKRLVDRVFELKSYSETENFNEQILRNQIDDALNSMESRNELDVNLKVAKLESDQLSSKSTIENLEYREYLTRIFSQYEKPNRKWLICSSSYSSANNYFYLLSLSITSLAIQLIFLHYETNYLYPVDLMLQ